MSSSLISCFVSTLTTLTSFFASQVPDVIRVSLSKIGTDLTDFRRQVEVVHRELKEDHSSDSNDGFVKFMEAFSDRAKRKFEVTEAVYKQMLTEFDKMWVSFGYELDGRTDKLIADFWTILSNFRRNMKTAREKNEQAEKQQKEIEERARLKAEGKGKRHASKKKFKKGLFEVMDNARKGSAADVIAKQKIKLQNSTRVQKGGRRVRCRKLGTG